MRDHDILGLLSRFYFVKLHIGVLQRFPTHLQNLVQDFEVVVAFSVGGWG
jgi:hypothetical protein